MNLLDLESKVKQGDADQLCNELGLDKEALPHLRMRHRIDYLTAQAREVFSWTDQTEVEVYSSPARIRYMGDYGPFFGGDCLGSPVHLDMLAISRRRDDQTALLTSHGFEPLYHVELDDGKEKDSEAGEPSALLRGVASYLLSQGYPVKGFEISLYSLIPGNMNFASSTALACLFGTLMVHQLPERPQAWETLVANAAVFAEEQFLGRKSHPGDAWMCLGGPFVHVYNENQGLRVRYLHPPRKFDDYAIVNIDSYEGFIDNEQEAQVALDELSLLAQALCVAPQELAQRGASTLVNHCTDVRTKAGDRALLRGLFVMDEQQRIKTSVKALDSQAGFGAFLDLVNVSTSTSYRQMQNIYSSVSQSARGIGVAIELSERWFRAMGIPAAMRPHGKGFSGSIFTFLPSNKSQSYIEYMDTIFGSGSGRNLYIRSRGSCQII